MPQKAKKFAVGFLLAVILGSTVLSTIVSLEPAYAQNQSQTVSDIPRTTQTIWDKILAGLKAAMINAGVKAASYALQRVAYDSAVWLASGGKGQNPMFNPKKMGGYLEDVANQTVGTMIEQLGTQYGLDLCKVPDIKVDLAIRIGLRTQFGGPNYKGPKKPACDGKSFAKNWRDGISKYNKKGGPLASFSSSLKADDSDFGIYGQATEKIDSKVVKEKAGVSADQLIGQGFFGNEEKISGKNKAPAQSTKAFAESQTPDKTINRNKSQLDSALAANDPKIWPSVLSLFLSTLGSNLLKNYFEKGLVPGIRSTMTTADILDYANSGASVFGRAAAQTFFSYLQTVKIKEASDYDLVSELNSCPDVPGIYNCRLGNDLVSAINQNITIGAALKSGVLDGSKKLIKPSDTSSNDIECYKSSYCLNNVKILRQVRIVPVGLELAIERSDGNWTLQQVVDGFYDCPANPANYDPLHPFCHLVDPNWVLKSPESKCAAMITGPNVMSNETPERLQECADLQTCVGYDKSGNCNRYGYCTNEKNTWKFSANSCDPQYATCRSFEDSEGTVVSYLYRTLDTRWCTSENAGCRAYSLSKAGGEWTAPSFDQGQGRNTGIYLNKNLDTTCSANSAGCSAFQVASDSNILYLKKAPDYLRCYDSNTTTAAVDWPQNPGDLTKLPDNPECKKYSEACIPDEASCNWYSPVSGGGEKIPGRFTPATVSGSTITWNDQCDARCVGYDAYREMPSNVSNGQDLEYIIPSSGNKCNSIDVGCSEFTNLSTSNGGVENTEYYSYLRPCEKPSDTISGKTFVTYEGSRESGFQLKTYSLLADASGAPQYFYKDQVELQSLRNDCTPANYQAGTANIDCRQFSDGSGNIYYAILSHTIPVDQSCTPYRITEPDFYTTADNNVTCQNNQGYWDGTVCRMCLMNGKFQNNSCVYQGLPGGILNNAGVSAACSASVNTCRAFKGNAGNNIQNIFTDDFESGSTTWAGASISNVSTKVGGHSLELSGNGAATKALTLENDASYQLTFWAKGTGVNVTVTLGGVQMGRVSVGDVWQQYTVGPVQYTGGNQVLQLSTGANTRVYFDNIRLVKLADLLYLVKNSLKVDPVCDSNQTDNLPGEALGCKAYTDPQNRTFYLTKFSNICRENAIGCTALFDTFNSVSDPGYSAYNVRLSGVAGTTASGTLGGDTFTCSVPRDQTWCYVNVTGHSAAEISASPLFRFVTSSVVISSDTPSGKPIYLIANQGATCSQEDKGCTYAGILAKSATGTVYYTTTTIKNDPDDYNKTVCTSEADGCNAYTDGADTRFFKDPKIAGQNVCEYKTNVRYPFPSGPLVSGWFKKGVNPAEPCYPTYNTASNIYGIWSSGNLATYQNYIGECPNEQNKCTEYIDHADNNRSYFLIKDDLLSEGDCSGQVSQKAGCALFDEKEVPNKFWNTQSSYDQSNAQDGRLVSPAVTNANDANVIIKVKQDRDCGEWLEGIRSYAAFDESNNKYKMVSLGLNRCVLNGSDVGGAICGDTIASPYRGSRLTEDLYRIRNITWSGMDYSGYSIPHAYSVDELSQVDFSSSTNPDRRLAYTFTADTPCLTENAACGPGGIGVCKNRVCIDSVDDRVIENSPGHECRAYPEKNSPFPNTSMVRKAVAYESSNICDEVDANVKGCECDYRKVQYGDSITKYWSIDRASSTDKVFNLPAGTPYTGICLNSSTRQCTDDAGCGDTPCEKLKSEKILYGWKGFCLEKDTSRRLNNSDIDAPCFTWYPVQSLTGATEINNQHIEAGGDWRGTAFNGLYCANAEAPNGTSLQLNFAFSPYWIGPIAVNTGTCAATPSRQCLISDNNPYPYDANGDPNPSYGTNPTCTHNVYIGPCVTSTNPYYCTQDPPVACWNDPETGTCVGGYDGASCVGTAASAATDCQVPTADTCQPPSAGGYNQGYGDPLYVELYYACRRFGGCSHGSDYVFSRGHLDIPTNHFGFNGNLGFANFPAGLRSITKNDIDYIEYRITGGDVNGPGQGPSYYVFPNATPTGTAQAFYSFGGTNVTEGFYHGRANELLHMRSPALSASGVISPWYATGMNGPLYSEGPTSPDIWSGGNSSYLCNFRRDGQYDNPAWDAIRFTFDPTSHLLVSMDTAFCGNTWSHKRWVQYQITFHMRERCQWATDARISYSNNTPSAVPWTNRLWSLDQALPFRSAQPYSVPTLNYTYSNPNLVYGSLGYQTIPTTGLLSLSPIIDRTSWPMSICVANANAGITSSNCDSLAQYLRLPTPGQGANYSCTSGNCQSGNGVNTAQEGMNRLLGLYAKVNNNFFYSIQNDAYQINNTLGTNVTETGDAAKRPVPPQVHPLGRLFAAQGANVQAQYEELPQIGITINGKSGGAVVSMTNNLLVSLDYFAYANEDQMPIRSMAVNWGNSSVDTMAGYLRNRRGVLPTRCQAGICVVSSTSERVLNNAGTTIGCTDTCEPAAQCKDIPYAPNYGLLLDRTCDNRYYHYENVYSCSRTLGRCEDLTGPVANWTNCFTTNADNCGATPEEGRRDFSSIGGCCIFQPKVQVKDNWGWCNGSCGDVNSPGGTGCYDAEWKNIASPPAPIQNECRDHNGSYTPFNGKIIVAP